MKTFEKYMKQKEYDKVVNEIIELKLKHPLSDKDKLRTVSYTHLRANET